MSERLTVVENPVNMGTIIRASIVVGSIPITDTQFKFILYKMTDTSIQVVESDNTPLYLLTKAEIDTAIATAKAFPRSIKSFIDKATSIATLTPEIAASCTYSVPRQGKEMTGPSVRLAEIVCTSYGNINSGARIVADDGKTITAQGVCHDLETNNRVTIEVTKRVTTKEGVRFSDDMVTTTKNAACAIAFRNAVFKVIPAAVVTEIHKAAKECAKGSIATLPERRKKAVAYFKEKGVSEEKLCKKLGVKRIEDIDIEKISILIGMYTAIENQEETIVEMFEDSETVKEKKEKLKADKGKAGEQSEINMP